MVEGHVILIAACVPTLHPVYDKVADLFRPGMRRLRRPLPLRRNSPRSACKSSAQQLHRKQSFWSAIMPSFGTQERREAREVVAHPRTLEDAANLAYPPATIWKQTVRVGKHSRITVHRPDSY